MAHDVFISHSSKDKVIADAACATIEKAAIRCWVAPRDLLPGLRYAKQLTAAIKESPIFLLIFSEKANSSPAVINELEIAFNAGAIVLPFRIENVEPIEDFEYYVRSTHWLDAFTPTLEEHLGILVEKMQILLKTASVPQEAVTRANDAVTPASDRFEPSKLTVDLFLSFAGVDNVPTPMGESGWVDAFRKALEDRLTLISGRKVCVWSDMSNLQLSDGVRRVATDGIREAKLFLSILSPSYVRSTFCRRELELFEAAAELSGGLFVRSRSRAFFAEKLPVDSSERPSLARDVVGYSFFEQQERAARELDLHSHEFLVRLNALAYDIVEVLNGFDMSLETFVS